MNGARGIVNPFRITSDAKSMIDRAQLRAARALLGWSQERLSDASGVSLPTVKRLEPGQGALQTKVETLQKLQSALESAGVEFGANGSVRLRDPQA